MSTSNLLLQILYKIISEKFGKGLRPIDVTWEFKKLELDDE